MENADIINALTKKYGITISAVWCGWEGPCAWNFYEGPSTLGLVPPEYRWQRIVNLRTGSDFAKMLGVTDIVTHMGFIPENPANCILYGKANPVDTLDVFGKYVRNLHAKDGKYPVNGHELGVETAIGEGKVDFDALICKLHELDYNGFITIEREIEGDRQLTDILKARELLEGYISKYYN